MALTDPRSTPSRGDASLDSLPGPLVGVGRGSFDLPFGAWVSRVFVAAGLGVLLGRFVSTVVAPSPTSLLSVCRRRVGVADAPGPPYPVPPGADSVGRLVLPQESGHRFSCRPWLPCPGSRVVAPFLPTGSMSSGAARPSDESTSRVLYDFLRDVPGHGGRLPLFVRPALFTLPPSSARLTEDFLQTYKLFVENPFFVPWARNPFPLLASPPPCPRPPSSGHPSTPPIWPTCQGTHLGFLAGPPALWAEWTPRPHRPLTGQLVRSHVRDSARSVRVLTPEESSLFHDFRVKEPRN